MVPRVTTLVVPAPLESLSTLTVPRITSPDPKLPEHFPDFARFLEAVGEHETIFGERSHVILVWPDHYLSYETTRGSIFHSVALREHLESVSKETLPTGSYAGVQYEDAVSAVRASTSFVGPAAFSFSDNQPEFPPLVAVVGYDSSRPRSLVIKSLAGIACPTVMFTQMISRDDLHAFVRLHESGHAFQHTAGRVKESDVETSYERCIIEAEADVFATLWWLKTRNGDETVPRFFAHLRNSNYFEHAARSCEELTVQYATHLPLRAALEVGAGLAKKGALSSMSAEEVHRHAQKIVALALPPEHQLRQTTQLLKTTLQDLWKHPFHARSSLIAESLTGEEIPSELRPALTSYLESVSFLTDPSHLQTTFPELAHLTLAEQAEQIWIRELIDDLHYAVTPSMVVERYSHDLAAAALAVWRFSRTTADVEGEELKRVIVHDGSPDLFFVPTARRERYLEMAQQILRERMGKE